MMLGTVDQVLLHVYFFLFEDPTFECAVQVV